MKISWTPKARQTYFEIIDHLEKVSTAKEILNFINEVDHLLEQIKQNPEMFENFGNKKNVRKGFVSKHITLYYRLRPRKKELQLIVFWDNRQNPGKLEF